MSHKKKIVFSLLFCLIVVISLLPAQVVTAKAFSPIPFILLSQYDATLNIGEEFYLIAVTNNGKKPSFQSSDSKIASVNTYGKITAKKAGHAAITAKIKDSEATCLVTVKKTNITISNKNVSLERGEIISLSATTSNQSEVIWKSSKKSVASIDEHGNVTGHKPGETTISASADGSTITCKVTVKPPTITLNKTRITLYRGQSAKISADVSSHMNPKWKTNKKSVAIVNEAGTVTAVKHGTAVITATLDGISKSCEVIVQQPSILLNTSELTLKTGENASLKATVSSGNPPVWSISNPKIISVDAAGTITALKKGKAYVYAAEDGIKVRCTIYVTE